MFQSIRHSQLSLRIGAAIVFIWYGVGKIMQPQPWLDAWAPQYFQAWVGRIGLGPTELVTLIGIFEVLVALSLATGFFMRYFAAAGAVFLVAVLSLNGFSEPLIPDIGITALLVALVLWPERSYV